MAEADRGYIPYGLNRIKTSRDISEEPSSSGGDNSPSRRNAMLWDGHRLAVPRVKAVGDGGRRSGNGKGFRKGRKFSRGCGSYLAPKDSSKPSKRIPSSSQAKRSGHLVDLKEMTRKQLVQESNLVRKAHATQKSFSYELASRRGIRQPQSRAHSYSDLKELLGSFHTKFEAAKATVNADLAAFVADVVNDLKKGTLSGEQESAEYLISLSHKCIDMEPSKFRDECEGIVHNVAERWQKSKLARMKQLLTRMLFILTRCSRILQLQNDSNPINEESLSKFKQCIERVPDRKWGPWYEIAGFETSKISDQGCIPKHASEDHNEVFGTSASVNTKLGGASPGCHRTSDSIIKKLHDIYDSNSFCELEDCMVPDLVICRICEEKVPASLLESHSYVCAFADKCDLEGFDFDERLVNIAEVLEQLVESYNQSSRASCSSPDISRMQSNISVNGLEGFSPMAQDSHQSFDWMFEDIHEMDTASIDDPLTPASRHWKSLLAMKLGSCFPASSNGSLSPASSITTPRSSHMDLFWLEHNATTEPEDVNQLVELVEIARRAAQVDVVSKDEFEYLDICWEDLSHILYNKSKSLIMDAFGKRVKNLLKDKYLRALEVRDENRLESIIQAETNDNVLQNPSESKAFPSIHLSHKEKTGIDDFEIIKPISRGAYGKVFLAKKRQTGDFFAIKVLKKLDMIRKNDIERILAERNILITVRNPFVVRFFYSFTCRDNLYLVMEYLNGGDLYSVLRKLGCLEEDVAKIYLAELVLALEYLHSLGIIHRDLKPDNILIASDGHIKLTDFGLSKIGLINHSIDLPGNSESEKEDASTESTYKGKESCSSAVGTPDYLAPEILLGTGHDCAADWWSVGIILFELLTGIPPFTARLPEMIFDNILNRKIPWHHVPNDISHEAKDLIDRLLVLDPHHRLGANGASEVKAHSFFKEIDWENLALQKAAFVPQPDSTDDTSYFVSRYASSSSQIEDDEISGDCTSNASNSSFYIDPENNAYEEDGLEPRASLDLDSLNFSFKNLSQLASMNHDVLVQSSKSTRRPPPNKGVGKKY